MKGTVNFSRSAAVGILLLLGSSVLVEAQAVVRIPVQRGAGGAPVPCAQDAVCHNRIHPAIKPGAFAEPGDLVVFETRDAADNQLNFGSTTADFASFDPNRVHPLTGPLYVNGAEAGDLLEVTIVRVDPGPDQFAWTATFPGFGFLRDLFPAPFLARWRLNQGLGTSPDVPGVKIPSNGFPGVITTAPGPDLLGTILDRELALLLKGGAVLPPEPASAIPTDVCGLGGDHPGECLRTLPPREHGGNFDSKWMARGARVLLPCFVPGCLLSLGDVHFAQGAGESNGTAMEMNAVVTVRVNLRKGQAALFGNRATFEGGQQFRQLAPTEFFATIGLPLKGEGDLIPQHLGPGILGDLAYFDPSELAPLTNLSEDLTLAVRDALNQMIDYLVNVRGLTRDQAYVLCSVAVDLHISNVVDIPNFAVHAVLPLEVFGRRDP